MSDVLGPDGYAIHKSDNEYDRILNSYYCGQIKMLHHIIYLVWKSKKNYDIETILKFVEARYCYLIREYPNFYNQMIKDERELGAEADNSYHVLMEEMLKHHKDIGKRKKS